MIGRLKQRVLAFLFKEEGGKNVLNQSNTTLLCGFIFTFGLLMTLVPSLLKEQDTSRIETTTQPITKKEAESEGAETSASSSEVGGIKNASEVTERTNERTSIRRSAPIKYKAKQVIARGSAGDPVNSIPTGASFVGKTLTAIDTRTPHTVKVILPYGGSHKGGGSLPASTILFGQVSYPGQGDRVHIRLTKGVLPDGQEVSLTAEALSSKDYSPGIIGEFHGNTGNRVAAVLGLSMVAGVSDVLVEKEALGQGYSTTPKATLKNGVYNGVAKVADMEASRQAERLAQTPEYVTIEAGTDLIVSLTGEYREK